MTHTSGPWDWQGDTLANDEGEVVIATSGAVVCTKANRDAIAATPAMIDALSDILAYFDSEDCALGERCDHSWIQAGKAALKLADPERTP